MGNRVDDILKRQRAGEDDDSARQLLVSRMRLETGGEFLARTDERRVSRKRSACLRERDFVLLAHVEPIPVRLGHRQYNAVVPEHNHR